MINRSGGMPEPMAGSFDIVLVQMPFAPVEWPSAGLGVLSAAVKRRGTRCRVTYPALRFAEATGYEFYGLAGGNFPLELFLHDWIFSSHVRSASTADLAAYIDELRRVATASGLGELAALRRRLPKTALIARIFPEDGRIDDNALLALREAAAGFVTRTAEAILADAPKVVGCTTTFMQFNASVSLLKEVKRLDPSVVTVLGGAGVEAEMGYQAMRRFPFVDLVFSGEADTLFPAVCEDMLAGADLAVIAERYPAGLLARPFIDSPHHRDEVTRCWQAPLAANLDALPIPDYQDYFAELAATSLAKAFKPFLPAESSRGCWKGAAQHCAFCGLQGERMAYRSKSPERVINELDELHRRHGNGLFLMTDTIIPMRSFKTVLPALAEEERPFSLFYEVPSKLTEEQVRQLAEAKVRWIQPGIESLDDRLLQLMNKGNRAIRNIETLKYCVEQGINPRWNILYNIPGEDDDSYRRMARIVPLLCHLPPPRLSRLRFDRFSPYHRDSAAFGLALRPFARSKLVYPFTDDELPDAANYFEDVGATFAPLPLNPAKSDLAERVGQWRQAMLATPTPPQLIQRSFGSEIEITDTRPCAGRTSHYLNGHAAAIYRTCRSALPFEAIAAALSGAAAPITAERTAGLLEEMRQSGLVIEIGGEWLALATNPPLRPLPAD